jgi:hypothetical protein
MFKVQALEVAGANQCAMRDPAACQPLVKYITPCVVADEFHVV